MGSWRSNLKSQRNICKGYIKNESEHASILISKTKHFILKKEEYRGHRCCKLRTMRLLYPTTLPHRRDKFGQENRDKKAVRLCRRVRKEVELPTARSYLPCVRRLASHHVELASFWKDQYNIVACTWYYNQQRFRFNVPPPSSQICTRSITVHDTISNVPRLMPNSIWSSWTQCSSIRSF